MGNSILCYQLTPYDNGCEFVSKADVLCDMCRGLVSRDYSSGRLVGDFNSTMSLSTTYNNVIICSEEFYKGIEEHIDSGQIIYHPIGGEVGFGAIEFLNSLSLQLVEGFYKDEQRCAACGIQTVQAIYGVFLDDEHSVKNGLLASDLLVGGLTDRHPLVFTGVDTKQYIEDNCSDIDFSAILSVPEVEAKNGMSIEELGRIIHKHNAM